MSPPPVESAEAEIAAEVAEDVPTADVAPAVDAAADASAVEDAGADADVARPVIPELCRLCTYHTDCGPNGSPLHCLKVNPISYCSSLCKTDDECPTDYFCSNSWCTPLGWDCRCSASAVSSGITGACVSTVGSTSCVSTSRCEVVDDLPVCVTRTAAPEVCNGIDDDCNGITDEGSADICDDGNTCTLDVCSPSGSCVHVSDVNGPCEDEDACTTSTCNYFGDCVPDGWVNCGADKCSVGVCDDLKGCSTEAKNCDDGNPCTADGCDLASGCTFTSLNGLCDDGNFCTTSDICSDGKCVASIVDCSDGVTCTSDGCLPQSGCFHLVGCDDGNGCTSDSCGKTGDCVHLASSGSCTDSDLCTGGETCSGGICGGGKPIPCDDGNACTLDSCDWVSGCASANLPASVTCTDGCGGAGACGGGVCKSAVGLGSSGFAPNMSLVNDFVRASDGGYFVLGTIASGATTLGRWKNGKWPWQVPIVGTGRIAVSTSGPVVLSPTGETPTFLSTTWFSAQGIVLAVQSLAATDIQGLQLRGVAGGPNVVWAAAEFTQSNVIKPLLLQLHQNDQGLQVPAPPGARWLDVTAAGTDVLAVGEKNQQTILQRLDQNGVELWQKTLEFGPATHVARLPNGFLVVTKEDPKHTLLTLDEAGNVVNVGHLPQGFAPGDGQLAATADSLLVLGGTKLAAVNRSGEMLWQTPTLPNFPGGVATDGQTVMLAQQNSNLTHLQILDAWGHDGCSSGGICLSLSATTCDDGDVSTIDLCDPGKGGCWHKAVSSACDDGESCTVDSVGAGLCAHVPVPTGSTCASDCGASGVCSAGKCAAPMGIGGVDIAVSGGFGQFFSVDAQDGTIWIAGNAAMQGPLTALRLGQNGQILWQQQYPLAETPQVTAIRALKDGIVVAGTSDAAWLGRIDANGTALWHHKYPPALTAALTSGLAVDGDAQGFLLGGLQQVVGETVWQQAFLLATDAEGNELWRRIFSKNRQRIRAVQRAGNGIVVGGEAVTTPDAQPNPWMAKLDAQGQTQWEVILPDTDPSAGVTALRALADGGLIAAGWDGRKRAFLTRLNGQGKVLWTTYFPLAIPADAFAGNFSNPLSLALQDVGQGDWRIAVGLAEFSSTVNALVLVDPFGRVLGTHSQDAQSPLTLVTTLADRLAVMTPSGPGLHLQLYDAWGNATCAASGICASKNASDCNDNDACTLDRCDSLHGGCWHQPLSATLCNDDNACTSDTCNGGVCSHSSINEGKPCAGACTGVCVQGQCAMTAGVGELDMTQVTQNLALVPLPEGVMALNALGKTLTLTTYDHRGKVLNNRPLHPEMQFLDTAEVVPLTQNGQVAVLLKTLFAIDALGISAQKASTGVHIARMGDGLALLQANPVYPDQLQIWAWDAKLKALWTQPLNEMTFVTGLLSTKSGVALLLGTYFSTVVRTYTLTGGVDVFETSELAQTPQAYVANDDVVLLGECTPLQKTCAIRVHKGQALWKRTLQLPMLTQELHDRGDGTALVRLFDFSLVAIDSEANVLWTLPAPENWVANLIATSPSTTWWRGKSGSIFTTDAWLNDTCEKSGPCLGKKTSDCSDGNPCTYDRCDAAHGGCFHPPVAEGTTCGVGVCKGGVCVGG